MSAADLAEKSGLDRSTITKLSHLTSWEHCTLDTILRFSEACGVDLLRPARAVRALKRNKLVYLQTCPPSQARMFDRLLEHFPGAGTNGAVRTNQHESADRVSVS